MKTRNLRYTSDEALQTFIQTHHYHDKHALLIQVFTGVVDHDFISQLLNTLTTLLPHGKIIGATSDGMIDNQTILQYETLLVFSEFETTQVESFIQHKSSTSYALGRALFSQLPPHLPIKTAICLCDGLHTNGEEFLDGLCSLNQEILIAGGMAADNGTFRETFVFSEEGISSNGAVVAILYGEDLIVHNDYSFGWEQIGKGLTITKSTKNRIYTINGIDAVKIYTKYIGGEISDQLPATGIEFPLIIQRDGIATARAVLKKHPDNSLSFAGNLYEGEEVRFGYGNIENILQEQANSLQRLKACPIESIFIYSCMARRRLLGNNNIDEIAPYAHLSTLSGFFTHGEFYHTQHRTQLLNETKTLLLLSESPDRCLPTPPTTKRVESSDAMKTINALSHLIAQTTQELVDINTQQSSLIQYEVEKNRQKDQLLLQQSKLAQMGEMIGMIAHQWRQPLNAISAVASSLILKRQLDSLTNEILDEKLEDINGYVQHLSATIDDFRGFFKPDRRKELTDIGEIIAGIDWLIGNIYRCRGTTLTATIAPNIQPFLSYPNELKQVILNLIKNAQDAIIEREIPAGAISVECTVVKQMLQIRVKDNAGGVPEEIKEKIFEFYFTTKEKDGTGIGLYMSQVIVQQHLHGSIGFYNDETGAVFTIKLPL